MTKKIFFFFQLGINWNVSIYFFQRKYLFFKKISRTPNLEFLHPDENIKTKKKKKDFIYVRSAQGLMCWIKG